MYKIILLFIVFTAKIISQDTVYIIIDEPVNTKPRNFRKCNGGFIREYDKMPDTTGLNGAKLSGSVEFGTFNFFAVTVDIGTPRITVAIRQETHILVNGISISWYGKYDWADVGLSMEQVLELEKKRMDSVRNAGSLNVVRVLKKDRSSGTFLKVQDTILNVETVRSEEELVENTGYGYFRITVTDRRPPTEEDADRFIEFARKLTPEVWLHFHCHAGDGRTTTFMAMYDMMKNAKKVNYDDIIERQYLLGGINLNKDDDYPDYEKPYAYQRTQFIKDFYEYCRTNIDNFNTSYSSWRKK
jgi:protein-tyrosine phosphatase